MERSVIAKSQGSRIVVYRRKRNTIGDDVKNDSKSFT